MNQRCENCKKEYEVTIGVEPKLYLCRNHFQKLMRSNDRMINKLWKEMKNE